MELPEPFVDTVDEDAGRSVPRSFVRHEPAGDDERRGCGSGAFRAEIVRQRLAKESARRHERVGASQASDRDVAQAAAHRVADEQRAGEHRDRRRHAERDGEVRAPVIPGAAKDQAGRGHRKHCQHPSPSVLDCRVKRGKATSTPRRLGLRPEKCAAGDGLPAAAPAGVNRTSVHHRLGIRVYRGDCGETAPSRMGAPPAHFSTCRPGLHPTAHRTRGGGPGLAASRRGVDVASPRLTRRSSISVREP